MLKIIILIGNTGLLVYSVIVLVVSTNINVPGGMDFFIPLTILIILSTLNIYFIIGTYRVPVSLHLKRKKLEEEIKIQEAENKLKELQKSKEK